MEETIDELLNLLIGLKMIWPCRPAKATNRVVKTLRSVSNKRCFREKLVLLCYKSIGSWF